MNIQTFWETQVQELSEKDVKKSFKEAWKKAVVDERIMPDTKWGVGIVPHQGTLWDMVEEEEEESRINPTKLGPEKVLLMYSPEYCEFLAWIIQDGVGEWYLWQV